MYSPLYLQTVHRNTNATQAAKKVGAERDSLVEMFERIEIFLRRLETYTEVATNQGMVDAITAIMVEVLNILGIATKQINQGRMSEFLPYKYVVVDRTISEKYLNKLIGRNDIEDALRKLDRLTQEEARVAAAQLLKVTNTIENRITGIADDVFVVDNRVAGIGDRVAGIDYRVAGIDDRIMDVDDKLMTVIDGAPLHLQSVIK